MPLTAKFLEIHTISHYFWGDNNPICPQTSSYEETSNCGRHWLVGYSSWKLCDISWRSFWGQAQEEGTPRAACHVYSLPWLVDSIRIRQNCGNYKKIACFGSHNSAAGSPGRSQDPDTVHLPITFVSNDTSLASLTEITHSPLTLLWQNVTVVCMSSLVTSQEERGEENLRWASGILAMLLANHLWHLENLVHTEQCEGWWAGLEHY